MPIDNQKTPANSGREFNTDEYAALTLPLQTRVALLVLLGLAVVMLGLLWEYYSVPRMADPATAVAATKKDATPSVEQTTTKSPAADSETPAAPLEQKNPEVVAALAEIELVATLLKEDPRFDPALATSRLKPFADSNDEAIRTAALKVLQPMVAALNAEARSIARATAESAIELGQEGKFSESLAAIEAALQKLSPQAPWSATGTEKLQALVKQIANERDVLRSSLLKEAEAQWLASPEIARGAKIAIEPLETLLKHPDPDFVKAGKELQARLLEKSRTEFAQKRQREAELRTTWMDFFNRFSAAVADGDLEAAEKLAKVAPNDPLMRGGVSDPEKVLLGCLFDLKSLRELQSNALNLARNDKRHVNLTLRRGRIEGVIQGVDGRQVQVLLPGGALVGVKIETLTSTGMMDLFAKKDLGSDPNSLAIGVLRAYENPAEALNFLQKLYASAKQPLPIHWEQRLKFEAFKQLDRDIGAKLAELSASLDNTDPDKVKAALAALRPVILAFEEFEPLSDARQRTLENAERVVGKVNKQRVVLQNGSFPNPDYAGLVTDQISQYKDSAKKTDVGVQYGLKVGASGGLQRVLIQLGGLEAAIGNMRLKRATLELYQIESPQFAGATVSLYRLKKPWVPDAGSWISYSAEAKCDWATPGASGETDSDSKEETKVAIDKQKNVWRAFDVTQYVSDVLAGKTQNLGLLMRVSNGEPDHQVRFYPETDLATTKDKNLRPRLILETEE